MEKQWTEQDLHSFVQAAQVVFDGVSLTEEQPEPGWQDESLQVDYELRGGRVDCVLHRIVEADGKRWKLQMSAPLAGNVLPEERMTPRERELCRDDMSHDFLTGSIFVVGSVDTTGPQLAARMQELYEQMPHECITTTGMMHRVQFTMSGAAAGLDEVEAKNWPALYELCDARLRKVQASGGDRIGCAE